VTAEAQTSVKLDPTDPSFESKIIFHVGQRKAYRFEVVVPDDLRLPEVTLPSGGIWSIEKEAAHGLSPLPLGEGKGEGRADRRSILKVHMQQGMLGDWSLILRGKLAAGNAQQEIALPRLEVLGVKRQEGDIRPNSSVWPPGSIRNSGPSPAWPCTTQAATTPAGCG
jgi:hypothetical protein